MHECASIAGLLVSESADESCANPDAKLITVQHRPLSLYILSGSYTYTYICIYQGGIRVNFGSRVNNPNRVSENRVCRVNHALRAVRTVSCEVPCIPCRVN